MKTARQNEINALAKAQERAQDRINFLLSLPDEPVDDGRPLVVYFQKRFGRGGRIYDYSACKAGNGLWYTTGPTGGHVGRTWDDLITWINDTEPTQVYLARKFKEI